MKQGGGFAAYTSLPVFYLSESMVRSYLSATVLLGLVIALTGCGSSEPLFDPSIVPRATVTGRVADGASGQPVAGVKVFVDGTTYQTTTNGRGSFRFSRVPVGAYSVVAHIPGYATATTTIAHEATGSEDVLLPLSVTNESSGDGNANAENNPLSAAALSNLAPAAEEAIKALQKRTAQLEARVTLLSRQVNLLRDEQRGTTLLSMNEEELENFNRFFLGKDQEECSVLNPGVLSFASTEGQRNTLLRVTTDQPLEVLNRKLGYRLNVVLNNFGVAEAGAEYAVVSDALIGFEALTPPNEDVAERWREARRDAYEGNLTHLLRALGAERTDDEGFTLARPIDVRERTSSGLSGRAYMQTNWIPLDDVPQRVTPAEDP